MERRLVYNFFGQIRADLAFPVELHLLLIDGFGPFFAMKVVYWPRSSNVMGNDISSNVWVTYSSNVWVT